jgi:hypothetical protein
LDPVLLPADRQRVRWVGLWTTLAGESILKGLPVWSNRGVWLRDQAAEHGEAVQFGRLYLAGPGLFELCSAA